MTIRPSAGVPLTALLIAFGYYVLGNATPLHTVWPVAIKHYIVFAVAAIALLTRPRQAALAGLLALPIATIYFIGGLPLYGVMVLVFGLSLPVFSAAITDVLTRRRLAVIAGMLLMSLVPALLSLDTIASDGILDTTYGRPRALLGYFHPKEAGVSFGIPLLIGLMAMRRGWMPATLVAAAFVFVVGSRNVSLVLLLSAALRRFPRATFWMLSTTVVSVILAVVIDDNRRELLDTLISLRLSVWSDALDSGQSAGGLDVLDGDRLAIDSFLVEAFVAAGWASPPLILLWLGGMALAATRRSALQPLPWVAIWLLVFFASFDSGLASTGNMMHIVLWSLVVAPLFETSKRSEREAELTGPILMSHR